MYSPRGVSFASAQALSEFQGLRLAVLKLAVLLIQLIPFQNRIGRAAGVKDEVEYRLAREDLVGRGGREKREGGRVPLLA